MGKAHLVRRDKQAADAVSIEFLADPIRSAVRWVANEVEILRWWALSEVGLLPGEVSMRSQTTEQRTVPGQRGRVVGRDRRGCWVVQTAFAAGIVAVEGGSCADAGRNADPLQWARAAASCRSPGAADYR